MRTLDQFKVQKDSIDTDDETVLFAMVFNDSEIMVLAKTKEEIDDIEVCVDNDPQNNIPYPHIYKAISCDTAEIDCPHNTDLSVGEIIKLTEQQIKDVNDVLYDDAKPM